MPLDDLLGPLVLERWLVDLHAKYSSSGIYVLSRTGTGEPFAVHYVGRSDNDLNGRLKDWVGIYRRFMFRYIHTAAAAYRRECELYHEFGEAALLDNEAHPAAPDGTALVCPVCGR